MASIGVIEPPPTSSVQPRSTDEVSLLDKMWYPEQDRAGLKAALKDSLRAPSVCA